MNENLISRIPSRYFGYLSLAAWAVFTFFMMRHDSFWLNSTSNDVLHDTLALDEGASKALLLVWSVADQVVSSVLTLGAPDLRVLFFAPAGFLATGSVIAAKIFTILAVSLTAWLLFSWKQRYLNDGSALFAVGLLLISPLTLIQIDALSPGVYLLLSFTVGAWLDKTYRESPIAFNGWYFAQLFISAFAVSLHPAGFAYPLALLWSWHKQPVNNKQKKYFFIGIGFVVFATIIITFGWHNILWFSNPIQSLSYAILGTNPTLQMSVSNWISGGLTLCVLALVIYKQHRLILSDITGRILLLALLLSALSFDLAASYIALVIILFYGIPLLIQATFTHNSISLFSSKNLLPIGIISISTLFMLADRTHYEYQKNNILSGEDKLINIFAKDADEARTIANNSDGKIVAPRYRIASQWPSRTMIACKCDTLPLPPAAKSPQEQLKMLNTVTHLMFNPRKTDNILLARNLAALGGSVTETISFQPEGVLLHFKTDSRSNSIN